MVVIYDDNLNFVCSFHFTQEKILTTVALTLFKPELFRTCAIPEKRQAHKSCENL